MSIHRNAQAASMIRVLKKYQETLPLEDRPEVDIAIAAIERLKEKNLGDTLTLYRVLGAA